MFWFDKYQPLMLEQFDFHKSLSNKLVKISKSKEMPNLLFYSPTSSGKKSLIQAFLYKIYGEDIFKITKDVLNIKIVGSSTILYINVYKSSFHIIVDPTQKSNYDRYVIQYIIKNYMKIVDFNIYLQSNVNFRTIVILNSDSLSNGAQLALRNTLEKNSGVCRFILSVSNITKLIEPLLSRFLIIRVPTPSDKLIKSNINKILKMEGIKIQKKKLDLLFDNFEGNYKRILLAIEGNQQNVSWIELINKILENIVEKMPDALFFIKMREQLYDILINNIELNLIFRQILKKMLSLLNNDEDKIKVINIIADYESKTTNANKIILYIEGVLSEIAYFIHR